MDDEHYWVVKQKYENRGEDFTELFQTILSIASQTGLDRPLKCPEKCVIEKRLLWLGRHLNTLGRTGDPIGDAYRIFYEAYLGISTPRDGEIVEKTDRKLVTRWWNYCPVLEVCVRLGLDTREICRKAYHEPVQVFLSKIDPRLRFDRNYDRIRPHAGYCEEIITLEA